MEVCILVDICHHLLMSSLSRWKSRYLFRIIGPPSPFLDFGLSTNHSFLINYIKHVDYICPFTIRQKSIWVNLILCCDCKLHDIDHIYLGVVVE